ncbi:outer membrane protein [Alcanivorax sp. DP30]|uniref:outer membrane protein n=1 Tax=Alcanivorax sp. DP30 TaxID=2606217 RepID=UPI00136F0D74|nr:outer membrane beta-barrel protein [Alcanivorax sp. DP30]MZR61961.1 outer membrane beta-barrel protein [Alcanivorax sp. DP30]
MKAFALMCGLLILSGQLIAGPFIRLGYGYSDFRSQDMSIKHDGYPEITLSNYDPGSADQVLFSAGYFVSPHFRVELALDMGLAGENTDRVTYSRGTSVTGEVTAEAYSRLFMVNGYFHFNGERGAGRFDPYMGGGIGLAVNRFESVSSRIPTTSATINDSDDTDWAFKLGGGLMYWVTDNLSADLSIAYTDAGSVTTEDRAFLKGVSVPFAEGMDLDLESFNYGLALLYQF